MINQSSKDIFDRIKAGEPIRLDDPEYPKVWEVVCRTIELSAELNASTNVDQIRERLSEIIGTQLDESTTLFAPFYTNFGRFTKIGKAYLSTMPVPFWIWEELPLKTKCY